MPFPRPKLCYKLNSLLQFPPVHLFVLWSMDPGVWKPPGRYLGLATLPVYGYDHIDYGHLPYKKHVLPVQARVPAYPYRTLTVCPYMGKLSSYYISSRGSKLYWSFKSISLWTINSTKIKSVQAFTYLYMNHTKTAVQSALPLCQRYSDGTCNTLPYIHHIQVMVAGPTDIHVWHWSLWQPYKADSEDSHAEGGEENSNK